LSAVSVAEAATATIPVPNVAGSPMVVVSATARLTAMAYAIFNVLRLKLWKSNHTRKQKQKKKVLVLVLVLF
jgi:hypothetical protein